MKREEFCNVGDIRAFKRGLLTIGRLPLIECYYRDWLTVGSSMKTGNLFGYRPRRRNLDKENVGVFKLRVQIERETFVLEITLFLVWRS